MIFIILPVYNEQENIVPLLKRIALSLKECRHDYKVILVDDGSTDKTAQAAASLTDFVPMTLLTHEKNRGLGEALKTGLIHTVGLAQEQDVIITMDADNTHIPGLIMRLHRNIWEGYDVVIASRYVKNARCIGVPLVRRILSRSASLLFRIFFPITGVRDYTCGYRAYQAGLLKKAFEHYGRAMISEPGFACMVDILLKLKTFHPIMGEVPIVLRYDRRKEGSKMKVGKTIRETLRLLVRRLMKR